MEKGLIASAAVVLMALAIACGAPAAEGQPPAAEAPAPTAAPDSTPFVLGGDVEGLPPAQVRYGWNTDFSKHSVPYEEIIPGGPPRDGIPPIDSPRFVGVASPPQYMKANEPVIALELDGQARAYPLAILMVHEVVNDTVGDTSVVVTFCPLCNSALVFERAVDGTVLDFGTTGNLRHSNLIMYDRQTQSWWQQATGEAIAGELTGKKLRPVPAQIVSWSDFVTAYPQGMVLSRDTGFRRNYDVPPYLGYDDPSGGPMLYFGPPDSRLRPMERVVGLVVDGQAVTYPFSLLQRQPVVNDSILGRRLVIFYSRSTLSPFAGVLNAPPRAAGAAGVYVAAVDGRELTFKAEGGRIVDVETGSTWNIFGQSVEGPLKGQELEPLLHGDYFWFAWAAFYPDTIIRGEPGSP